MGCRIPREAIEVALAHVVRDRVEAALCPPSDLFERHRVLMNNWACYSGPRHRGRDTEPVEERGSWILPLRVAGHRTDSLNSHYVSLPIPH